MSETLRLASAPTTSRSTSATVRPNILRYLVAVAAEGGVDLQPLLDRVGLGGDVLQSASLRVSYRQGSTIIRQAITLTGDAHLGLRVGAAQHVTAWGLLGFALMSANTLRHAIETGVKYQNLSGAMMVWSTAMDGDDLVLRADLPDPALDPPVATFMIEEAFSSVLTVARLSVGPALVPRLIEFTLPPPADPDVYHAVFGCPVRFAMPASRLVIDKAWARKPMPGRDPVTFGSVLQQLEQQMGPRRDQQDLLEVLEISIAQSLPDIPSFAEQARRHAASERTLRRRLVGCGTTYEALVDGVRRERVEQLLLRSTLTLRDIARQVGFADERTLRRAVRRWHGTGPLQLRADLLESEQPATG